MGKSTKRLLAACLFLLVCVLLLRSKGVSPLAPLGSTHEKESNSSHRDGSSGGSSQRMTEEGHAPDKEWFIDSKHPSVEFSGQVLLNDQAKEGIEVVLIDEMTTSGAMPSRSTKTDAKGHFRFVDLPCIRGNYRVSAAHPGASPGWNSRNGCTSLTNIDIRLETCKNFVYGSVFDASGGTVASAKIHFEAVPEQGVLSDEKGDFRLCTGPGFATLKASGEGYGTWKKGISTYGTTRQDISLMPEASLDGKVVFAKDQSPVPFAIVLLDSEGASAREAETQADEQGQFHFPKLAPGRYRVEARSRHAKSHPPVSVSVFASTKASVTVSLSARARVSGRVTSASGPEKSARLNFGFHATSEWGTGTTTNEAGEFVLEDAPIGTVFVNVEEFDIESPRTLNIPPEGLENVALSVARKSELKVLVTRNKAPVREAMVYARSNAASKSRRTNPQGIATFRGIAEGDYRIVAEFEGSFGIKESVKLAKASSSPSEAPDATIELTEGRQVRGRVIDEQGKAVDGATVTFSIQGSTQDSGATAFTDSDGRFQGGPLRGPAKYALQISRSGVVFEPKSAFAVVAVPEEGPALPADGVWIVKALDRELSGKVIDADNEPAVDARVVLSPLARHNGTLATTFTGADGSFHVRGLSGGPYTLTANAANGSEVERKPVTLPTEPILLQLPAIAEVHGTLKGFVRTPTIIAWKESGYDWHDIRYGVIEGNTYSIRGLSRGRYFVGVASQEAADTKRVDLTQTSSLELNLVASSKRALRGRARDLLAGGPLPGLHCQSAPYIEGSRSPVVVPTSVFTDAEGAFAFTELPASDLYMWCLSNGQYHGGVAKLPNDLGEKEVSLWGLDLRGRPPASIDSLGVTLVDDYPFSRRIETVDVKGPGKKAGILVGDVIVQVDGKDVSEAGNGVVRNFIAVLLAERHTVPIVLQRGDKSVLIDLRAE